MVNRKCAAAYNSTCVFNLHYQNLTKSLSKIWQKWLKLDASQLATVSAGGYYTTLVEGFPGLRILALNTDYGYGRNHLP